MWVTYKEKLKIFSQRLVDAQKPVRLIDAVKWEPKIIEDLRKSRYKELPKVDANTYAASPLSFKPEEKIAELQGIIDDIVRDLGDEDALAHMLIGTCREYQDLVRMLDARGTSEYYEISKKLYGSPKDCFLGTKSAVKDLGIHLYNIFSSLDDRLLGDSRATEVDASTAVTELERRFDRYFPGEGVRVLINDEMIADASASSRTIKLRGDAKFVKRDIDILEVHEGWVHMGTTINGHEQKIARWLYRGSPRATATQEGLAVLMEILTFVSSPRRARKINDRVLAIDKAEDGANFIEIFEYFRTEGYAEEECLVAAQRVFRGGVVSGRYPLTKDIAYCKGFVENYNFIRACIQSGKIDMLPFLFVGKVTLEDIPVLYQKYKEGIIDAPKYLPPFFKDLNSLTVWMSFANFLSHVDMGGSQEAYRNLIVKS